MERKTRPFRCPELRARRDRQNAGAEVGGRQRIELTEEIEAISASSEAMAWAIDDLQPVQQPRQRAEISKAATRMPLGAPLRTAPRTSAPSTLTPMKATTRPMPVAIVMASCRGRGDAESSVLSVASHVTSAASSKAAD